ncbi:MAG: DUF3090 family protein [bacterium]|nr:DUF3090 family protein [bacterium]
MSGRDFGSVNRFLVGAIGEPGKRTFYIFIESEGVPSWFKFEKGQAAALGEQGLELLSNLGWTIDEDEVEGLVSDINELPPPSGPEEVILRVRSIAMRIDSRERMTVMLEGDGQEERVVFAITAEQLRAAAILSLRAVHSGRAQCPDCLLPEDPEGHQCPSSNGHRLPG